MNLTGNPKLYGLPHDTFRPYQEESILWALNGPERLKVAQFPTGQGKSSIASALGSQGHTVTTLTRTHSLQSQYINQYGFVDLKGLRNYPCALFVGMNGDMCAHKENMYGCQAYKSCAYLKQRDDFRENNRRVTNYHYFAGATWWRDYPTSWLVLDEGHSIIDFLLDQNTFRITRDEAAEYGVQWDRRLGGPIKDIKPLVFRDMLLKITVGVSHEIARLKRALLGKSRLSKRDQKNRRKVNYLSVRHEELKKAMGNSGGDKDGWILIANQYEAQLAPLSPQGFFVPMFQAGLAWNVLIMSATIGNIDTFTNSLGITQPYAWMERESPYPPEQRPIYILDAPRMGYRTTELERQKQAEVIAQAIKDCDPSWSGILHFASYAQTNDMAHRLHKQGLGDRLYVPPRGKSTQEKVESVLEEREKTRNVLVLSPVLQEGVDFGQFQINICCKVPYGNLGDEVVRARMEYDRRLYQWNAALGITQMLGRTRRGEDKDYDIDEQRGFVAIADNNYRNVRQQFSTDMLLCLRDY